MNTRRVILTVLGIVLFVIGYVGLFPISAVMLLSAWNHLYTAGLSATPQSGHAIGAVGGSAAVAGIWSLSSAFRKVP
ncbi:MAG TPA: hypothetical protein VGG48_09485 [Rhizomicrobium sp.]|jgi:hypothetical protein